MNSTYINTEKILRVKLDFATQSTRYKWMNEIPKKKFLWFTLQKPIPAGWYDSWYHKSLEEDDILTTNKTVYKNKNVLHQFSIWDKPKVEITSQSGKYTYTDSLWFDTDAEAAQFAKEITDKFPHIKI